ncbi:Nab6p CYBJADRAFT_124878, partial [Cyberlindnera jadinii NRRL Y-1542]
MSSVDPSVSITSFLDCVKFGPIESARIAEDYPDPGVNSIALTFLKVETCLHFYNNLLTYFAKFKDSIHSPDLTINFANCKKLLPFIANAINNDGATRNVYIGNLTQLNRHISTEFLSSELTKFGIIDKIDLIDKGTGEEKEVFAFVHFTNVASAIKAVEQLSFSSEWENCKIFYGPDRCSVENDNIVNALNQKSVTAAAVASTSGGLENIGNRTICISNLDPSTKVEDICNTVRGGLLQVIRFLPERKMCFMTFVEAEAAAQFFANANIHPIILHSRRLKIGWGHHSGQLPNSIQLEVSAGASRNVYIGQSTESADAENDEVLPDEAIIRKDFSSFGEVEQINFIKDNKAVFVNFLNISHAIKVVKDANGDFENDFHEYFENRYRGFKINFGKDRCGNPPKAR